MADRHPIRNKLVGKLAVETEFGAFLGGARIRLLEAIERYGSISRAAKAVPLSYKAAWDALDAMNNVAEHPLVQRCAGGRHGGGTTVTEYGRRVVAMYRAVEQDYQEALNRLAERLGEQEAGDARYFQTALRRMSVRTSARNQFVGPVAGLSEGRLGVEVRVKIDERNEMSSLITRKSAQGLQLRIGTEVHAFFKAASVELRTDSAARRLARNALWGSVARIDRGSAHAEVTVALDSGRHITAICAPEQLDRLRLETGKPCCAVIDASSVVLFRFD